MFPKRNILEKGGSQEYETKTGGQRGAIQFYPQAQLLPEYGEWNLPEIYAIWNSKKRHGEIFYGRNITR